MNKEEKEHVIEHSKIAQYSDGVMQKAIEYCGEIFKRNMVDGSVLELGPAEGVMTDILYPYFEDYTVVDGADFFVSSIKDRYPAIKGFAELFEDYEPENNKKYNNIVLGHVLEHVLDPVGILKKCSSWLEKGGRVLAAVPNSHSIHRQAAVIMGMLQYEKQLNSTDEKNGHRRVYDLETLQKDFIDSGLKIQVVGGYWLKPLSNGQINEYWNDSMIDAFLRLGERYPEVAGELYIVASN